MNSALTLTLFILSIVIAVLIARHYLQSAKPLYVFSVMSLGGVRHPDIDLIYDGHSVPTIHSVKLVFWNAGRKEIRRKDLPEGDAALKINVGDGFNILGVDAHASNRCAASAEILDMNTVSIAFEFLNKRDNYYCELICTNVVNENEEAESDPPAPKLDGSIIGAKIRRGNTSRFARSDVVISILGIFAVLLMAGVWFAKPFTEYLKTGEPVSLGSIAFGLIYILIMLPFMSATLFGFTKRMVPKARKQLHEPLMPTQK